MLSSVNSFFVCIFFPLWRGTGPGTPIAFIPGVGKSLVTSVKIKSSGEAARAAFFNAQLVINKI